MNSWGPSLDPPRSSSGTVQLFFQTARTLFAFPRFIYLPSFVWLLLLLRRSRILSEICCGCILSGFSGGGGGHSRGIPGAYYELADSLTVGLRGKAGLKDGGKYEEGGRGNRIQGAVEMSSNFVKSQPFSLTCQVFISNSNPLYFYHQVPA